MIYHTFTCNFILFFKFIFSCLLLYWELFWIYLFLKYVQCWIYKDFPSVASSIAIEDYDERKPHAWHWKSGKTLLVSMYCKHLNRLTSDFVCWISYDDHRAFKEFEVISLFFRHIRWCPSIVIHWSKRAVREFGYVQTIPPHFVVPSLCIEYIDDRWIQFSKYIAPVSQICVASGQCSTDYME